MAARTVTVWHGRLPHRYTLLLPVMRRDASSQVAGQAVSNIKLFESVFEAMPQLFVQVRGTPAPLSPRVYMCIYLLEYRERGPGLHNASSLGLSESFAR